MNDAVTYSELRSNLKFYLDKVCDEHEPLLIKRRDLPDVVLVARDDYEKMDETAYLNASPANAAHLRKALETPIEEYVVYESMEAFKKEWGIED